jgi:hypothetical protein
MIFCIEALEKAAPILLLEGDIGGKWGKGDTVLSEEKEYHERIKQV